MLCARLGSEEFEIVKILDSEYRVKSSKTGKEDSIYKVHCQVSPQMMAANARRRSADRLTRASKIGNPTPKRK